MRTSKFYYDQRIDEIKGVWIHSIKSREDDVELKLYDHSHDSHYKAEMCGDCDLFFRRIEEQAQAEEIKTQKVDAISLLKEWQKRMSDGRTVAELYHDELFMRTEKYLTNVDKK